ncbi:hypothetical protein J3Q64DRAFT_1713188 [Phycomyces blakesleeanus]|uniref:C2H2-type domain-containing protein n=1 Tax=Phycomyces blakesleeanus TaxID=4837 RepID=A0ABR3BEW4_PHYBL
MILSVIQRIHTHKYKACSTHESNTDTACSTHESNTDIPTYFLVTTQSICQSSSITTERKFVCSNLECTKTFKTKHACQSHEISHSDKRPFLCNFPDCSYTTARNHDLSRHKKKHDPKYRQSCDLCKHSYARSDCLKKHVCNPTIGSDERDAPKRLKWSRRNKFLPSSPSD